MPDPTARPNARSPDSAADRLRRVRQRIEAACLAAGRPADAARLLAVSKTVPVETLADTLAAGQTDFGESYLQEALPKIVALAGRGAHWHFIGPIQSNKTRDIAAHFDWVHGVDRLRIAERLSSQRPAERGLLQVCVQVNISGEDSKSGCTPDEAPALCAAIARLPGLSLRGLMAIPAPVADAAQAHLPYRRLQALFATIKSTLGAAAGAFDTVSAGMSDDLEAAIAEGSTLVRVGTALFGARPAAHP